MCCKTNSTCRVQYANLEREESLAPNDAGYCIQRFSIGAPPPFRGGFSLIEIMVVLVIIGLLAGVVTLNVRGYLAKAKQNTARMEIATLSNALESYYTSTDRYPTNEEGLEVLTKKSDWQPEPLIKQVPVDPWGRGYFYNNPGKSEPYEVISLGADGREGGEGADADIVSSDLKEKRREITTTAK